MPDYQNGKIYRIVCNVTGKQYIGSTTLSLSQRLAQHVQDYTKFCKNQSKYRYITSIEVIKNQDYDIILLEECKCDNKEQLHKRERYYIESNICVNRNVPQQTKKEWDIKNRLHIQQYRRANGKMYRNAHIEQIQHNANRQCNCMCGSHYTHSNKARHLNSPIHKAFMARLYSDDIQESLEALNEMHNRIHKQ